MGGPTGHPDPSSMDGWMRQQEKKVLHEERRPRVHSAADLLGPGIAPHAVLINDWSSDQTEFNGYFYSKPGALHAPSTDQWWIGQTIAQIEGFGIQTAWDYRGSSLPVVTKTRRFSLVGGTRVFSPWA